MVKSYKTKPKLLLGFTKPTIVYTTIPAIIMFDASMVTLNKNEIGSKLTIKWTTNLRLEYWHENVKNVLAFKKTKSGAFTAFRQMCLIHCQYDPPVWKGIYTNSSSGCRQANALLRSQVLQSWVVLTADQTPLSESSRGFSVQFFFQNVS